jgi:hypothetical protein
MADEAHNAPASAWNTQYQNYLSLTQKLDQAQLHERDALERAVAEIEEDLLDTPAPHLTAVRQKLEMLFEGQMDGLDTEAEARRLVTEDLQRLILVQRELLGA